ncbi:NADH:ubiquinone oxidoreductase subunit C [Motilibacter peucedani]|uniref:NADH-quinone oxidoreductase n=1 Tax=Motilibacter peucedani TaxID=598650 RepID=A0A420XL15_9ACTN|nr:NADH-quinone oxidoreductase subunit C [Motilibacter peucedani]RKS69230.1 NADH:ubiquinone oxidoreductase subunit C [Motilibacter peucedani]
MSAPFETAQVEQALAGLGAALRGTARTLATPSDLPRAAVAPEAWAVALRALRDGLGTTWFDWLTGVDESDHLEVVACLLAPSGPSAGHGVLLTTALDPGAPVLETAVGVFRGAAWHEREAHEMFGIDFAGHPRLRPLLLPPGFEGHPLRKDFVLASRVARPWPGEHEPSGRTRRRALPPGVPEPGTWGEDAAERTR